MDSTSAQKESGDPERPLAAAIDIALLAAVASLLTLPARVFGYEHRLAPDVALIGVAIAIYYLAFELVLKATPGKLLVGLRVTMLDGGSPAAWRIIVRNLLRIVDVLPAFYFVGAAAIAGTKHRQRFGDLAAGTIVRSIPASERTRSRREAFAFAGAVTASGGVAVIVVLVLGEVILVRPSIVEALALAIGAAAIAGAFALSSRNARYGILTVALFIGACSVWIVAWTDRYTAAADHTAEIRSMIDDGVPVHTRADDVIAFFQSKRIQHSGTETNKYSDHVFFDGNVLHKGDRYISAYVPNSSWGFLCSFSLTTYVVLVDDRVDRIIYEEVGDACP